jgi:hypothetical protein
MDSPDVLRFAVVAIVTAAVVLGGLTALGIVVLFRRGGRPGGAREFGGRAIGRGSAGRDIQSIETRAGSLLLQLDEQLRDSDDELGFAIAQFGIERSRRFADAVRSARAEVTEAFRLKQQLDDAFPESDRQHREWTLQVIALCERAQKTLTDETAVFSEFRRREVDAAASLDDLRTAIDATRARLEPTRARLAELAETYHPARSLGVANNVDAAATLLDDATRTADAVAPRVSAAGVSNIADELQEARQHVHHAQQQLDDIDRTAADLAGASEALATLVRDTERDLADAKVQRDAAPDAETGEAIIRAIASVEAALAAGEHTHDPIAELDRVGNAVAELDLALASARNQQQRLEHARAALVGTLVSAKSQIAEVRGYIGGHGGGVDARTRLAEAERQLMLAEAEADPVEALDTARRAVTHARDADALARFDTMN